MLECDYLVVGTGASGMAFVDAIVSQSKDRTVIMVDKLAQPGGHWNHAYDFVKLHQPACFYGVSSEKLEREGETARYKSKDMSSKQEILDYYRYVMDKMVKTGRVKHYPECTFQHGNLDTTSKDGSIPIQSFVDKEGITQEVKVNRRVVDATYLKVAVPSTHPPNYKVDPGVTCVPVNGIHIVPQDKKFVVVGSGKTGIDAVLHLLDSGVDPSKIAWVMPRDAWLFNREFANPTQALLNYPPILNAANSLKESLLSQERDGMLLRLDPNVWPEKYSCATVESSELEKLKSIRNVIRKGRVTRITKTHLIMTGKGGTNPEEVPYEPGSIIVDCSSCGLPPRPEVPIFEGSKKITIQPLLFCVVCISAAMIGYVECHDGFRDDADRNQILVPAPYPTSNRDYARMELLNFHNALLGFGSDPRTETWFNRNRLNMDSHGSAFTWFRLFAGDLYRVMSLLPESMDAKKRAYQMETGQEFEFQTYSPTKMNKLLTELKVMTAFFWVALIAVSVSLFFGLRFLMQALYVH